MTPPHFGFLSVPNAAELHALRRKRFVDEQFARFATEVVPEARACCGDGGAVTPRVASVESGPAPPTTQQVACATAALPA
jgi:hypothetical protein